MASTEINFADCAELAGSIGKASGAAAEREPVVGDREQSRVRQKRARSLGFIDTQRLTVICHPVVLHSKDVLISSLDFDSDGALQIAGSNAQGRRMAIDLAKTANVGQNCVANIGAIRDFREYWCGNCCQQQGQTNE